jgi:hypothetical protein
MKVDSYPLHAANGARIRMATKVEDSQGRVLHFLERVPRREAIAQAASHFELADAVSAFHNGEMEKYPFYAATAKFPAAQVASAAGIPLDVVLDRRRYLQQNPLSL